MTVARLRPSSELDLVERTRYFRQEGGDDLAARFFDTAVAALRAIERMPGAGSPLVGEACNLPGLRVRRIPGFPSSWLCFAGSDHVDVVRLPADAQDLPSIVADIEPG